MQERREHSRFRCKLRVGVLFPDGRMELLWAEEVSYGGLSIHTERAQRVGVCLRVLLFLFSHQLDREVQAEMVTKVASCVLDNTTCDFRLGLCIEQFVGDAESHFMAQIDHLASPLRAAEEAEYGAPPPPPPPAHFPLHRRVKLALAEGRNLAGWTEEVTPATMRIALSEKLETASVHRLSIPVVLADEPHVLSVQAKARVESVIFRSMGAFATYFSVFDYERGGLNLLRRELRERFPEIAQVSTSLNEDGAPPEAQVEAENTETLPSLGDLGLYH